MVEAPRVSPQSEDAPMPTRNALAAVRLSYTQRARSPYHIVLEVWSHSYDHPDPNHRNALVTAVELGHLPPGNYAASNVRITDRYGIDQTDLWAIESGGVLRFFGYREWDAADTCAPAVFGVVWGNFTGAYDERCLADPACDSMRLQSYLTGTTKLQFRGFHYVAGPITFSFDANLTAPPTAIKIRMGHIGGNGGNPAQRWATLPDEDFVIDFA